MIFSDFRIVHSRNDDRYILAILDGNNRVICGGRFSSKQDAELALHIVSIFAGVEEYRPNQRITRQLQAIIDADTDNDTNNLELYI